MNNAKVNNNNHSHGCDKQSLTGISVTGEADKVLRQKIFGADYIVQRIEELGQDPFIGFLLHADNQYAYVEVGSSTLMRPTIALISVAALEQIPEKFDRQKV